MTGLSDIREVRNEGAYWANFLLSKGWVLLGCSVAQPPDSVPRSRWLGLPSDQTAEYVLGRPEGVDFSLENLLVLQLERSKRRWEVSMKWGAMVAEDEAAS